MHTVFVFAHQDDEVGASPWIEDELRNGNRVSCVYVTDGAAHVAAGVRDGESRTALAACGVDEKDIAILLSDDRIGDSTLSSNILKALSALEEWLDANAPDLGRIYSLAWEGGHPDHDAVHVISLLAAGRRGIKDAWQFSLYNGFKRSKPFFNVLRQIPARSGSRWLRHTLRSGLRHAMFCWSFPSQRRTWFGLFPGLFFRRVILRREAVELFDSRRVLSRPHEGELLYEWMFGTPYQRIVDSMEPILVELRGQAEPH